MIIGWIREGDKAACGGMVVEGVSSATSHGLPYTFQGARIACTNNCVIAEGYSRSILANGHSRVIHGMKTTGGCPLHSTLNDLDGVGTVAMSRSRQGFCKTITVNGREIWLASVRQQVTRMTSNFFCWTEKVDHWLLPTTLQSCHQVNAFMAKQTTKARRSVFIPRAYNALRFILDIQIVEDTIMPDSPNGLLHPVVAGETNITIASVKPGSTNRLGKPWTVSENLLQFLAIWENGVINGKNFAHQVVRNGFILKVYKDSRGLPTVGSGHLVIAGEKIKIGDKITEEKAKTLFKTDLATAERAVNNCVKIPLFQHEYDALVSLAFNTGANGASKLFDTVNSGKYASIPATIKTYRTGGGNEMRRESEAALFKSGVYDATH